jgi:hypothetical protein
VLRQLELKDESTQCSVDEFGLDIATDELILNCALCETYELLKSCKYIVVAALHRGVSKGYQLQLT